MRTAKDFVFRVYRFEDGDHLSEVFEYDHTDIPIHKFNITSFKTRIIEGQWIGRMDKKGLKIFEGDIVKNKSGRVMEVTYFACGGYATFDLHYLYGGGQAPDKDSLFFNLTIIGNKYENPELMEDSE